MCCDNMEAENTGVNQAQRVLDAMKKKGIVGVVVRKDGIMAGTTLAITSPELMASLANSSDLLMKKEQDKQTEIQISFNDLTFLIIPVKGYYYCASIKDKTEKKLVRAYAKKAAELL